MQQKAYATKEAATGKAIVYSLNQKNTWEYFFVMEDIKSVAETNAVMYSIVEQAKPTI